jgi:hypothetical protein
MKTSSTTTRLEPVPRRPSTSQLSMISTSSKSTTPMKSVANTPAETSSPNAHASTRWVAESQPET